MNVITKVAAEKYLAVSKQIQELYYAAQEEENDYTEPDQEKLQILEDFREKFEACTSMDDEAAIVLSRFKHGDTLRLDCLRSLKEKAAKYLARCHVNLSFYRLETLSDSAALALSQHNGGHLNLGGLQCISEEAVIHLSGHKNLRLSLPALTAKAARALDQPKLQLELREITELTPELASALGSCRGLLLLNSLKSDHSLAELLKHRPKGQWTHLDGLKSVSEESANAIVEAKTWVSLASGTKISHEAARRLLACPNSDVYKSWSWLRKVAKATPKKSAAKRVKPGCPPKVFAWITGGLLAVRANSTAVREILHCGEATPNQQNLMKDIDLIEEIDSGEWTLARCTLIEDPAIGLSGTLKTQTIHLIYDDTSGLMGFRLYDCGKLTEEEFLDAGTDENGLTKFQKTVDRRFKALGIGVPASAP